VTLPPGRARVATMPVRTESPAAAKAIGMAEVACLAARIDGVPYVTMISTLRRTNSATISAGSLRPSAQRYSIAIVRPSARFMGTRHSQERRLVGARSDAVLGGLKASESRDGLIELPQRPLIRGDQSGLSD
jgi:hypothetical protein